jgi:endoglucanase
MTRNCGKTIQKAVSKKNTAYVARTAEKLGFSWAYWQFDSDFIVFDIDKGKWVAPVLNAFIIKTPE